MKTKIKIFIVSCVIASVAVTGFNLAQNSNNMDVTLADIAVMASADPESGSDCESGKFDCSSGGQGSTSCSVSLTVGGVTFECDVTCGTGYYACCNRWCAKCECRQA